MERRETVGWREERERSDKKRGRRVTRREGARCKGGSVAKRREGAKLNGGRRQDGKQGSNWVERREGTE